MVIFLIMIINFADKETEKLFMKGVSRKYPQEIIRRTIQLLFIIDSASGLEDLSSPPGNKLHRLSGDMKGFWGISINKQWRIIFRFKDENAYDVKITDYH